MMKKYLSIIFALLMSATSATAAEMVIGHVLLNGEKIPAEYTVLTDSTVALGSGMNACISQYSAGRVVVPQQISFPVYSGFFLIGEKIYKVTEVKSLAFRFCDQLTRVQFKEGIKRIGDFAFKGCLRLAELDLPSTLESIGTGAFIGLKSLYMVRCNATTPPTWDYNDVFFFHETGISGDATQTFRPGVFLFVPPGCEEAYQASTFSDPSIGWRTPEGWGTAFANFNGSALENFHVTDTLDLEDVRRISNDPRFGDIKNLWLEADIEMNDTIWPTPIGASPDLPFKATVHGQNHTIHRLRVDNDSVAGLFGYCVGNKISGVRLEGGYSHSKLLAGGLVAHADGCTIDSCYINADVRSDGYAGGVAGKATGQTTVDRCVSQALVTPFTDDGQHGLGGLAGYASGSRFTNCAVQRSGNFIGESNAAERSAVDYCYALGSDALVALKQANINYGDHIIVSGQLMSYLDALGNKVEAEYNDSRMRSTFPASVLGLDKWVYTWDELPLPDCFIDMWPVRENYAVYGSEDAAQGRDNALTPTTDIPAEAWCDLSDIGFRRYPFKASRLRIDEQLNDIHNVQSVAAHLPLGVSQQITSANGVVHDAELFALYEGVEDILEPVYEIDDDKNFVHDADGNPVLLGETKIGEQDVWTPVGYAISLPYDVTFGDNATLYQPTSIYDVDGQTTALFEPVRDNRAEAFHAYYLVVRRDTVILGSAAPVTCTSLEGAALQVGDYIFSGAMSQTDYNARKNNTYTLEDGSWKRQSATDINYASIEPFTSFFRSVGPTSASKIEMAFGNDNPVVSVGDFYFTVNTPADGTSSNYTATLIGYHGRGGNTVVPASIYTAIGGIGKPVPVTSLGPDIFTKCTAEVWSIDLSQCTLLKPVAIDRTVKGNPFYKVDPRTIIYMPEGKVKTAEDAQTAATSGTLRNVVIGAECAHLDITDGWAFHAPYDFHADEAVYDRILYASKQQDGSFKTYAYTVCLPFNVDLFQQFNEGIVDVRRPYFYTDKNELLFSNDLPGLAAGKGYIVRINKDSVQLASVNVMVKAEPAEPDEVLLYQYSEERYAGAWRGTFSTIKNEDAAQMNACTLNSSNSKWYRIRSDEGRYRNAWVGPFRAFFTPDQVPLRNSYGSSFQQWIQGDNSDDNPIIPFDADLYATDTDFTGYEDDAPTGIGVQPIPNSQSSSLNSGWFTLDGRRLNGMPTEKGMYILNGRKVIIK